MQVCNEKLRELWHYHTTFGNLWFNVLSSFCSVVEILTICIVLGYYNIHVTMLYLWWPILECIRLFVLTIARVDVMLKESQYMTMLSTTTTNRNNNDGVVVAEEEENEVRRREDGGGDHHRRRRGNGGEYTRRLIVACNIMGMVTLLIGLPLFLALLSNNNHNNKNPLYMLSFTVYPLFALLRVVLSFPMFATMIWGVPFYRCYDGNNYERIADAPSRAGDTAKNSYSPSQDSLLSRPPRAEIPHEALWSLYENQQTQVAMEASRRDSYRSLREQQDREYEELLKAQTELERAAMLSKENTQTKEQETLNEMTSIDDNNNNKTAQETDVDVVVDESESLNLDPLPEEPASGKTTVRARVRLPNGARCTRLFTNENTLNDMKCWINHELVNNDLTNVVNRFRLISTHPRTVYEENDKTFEELEFWRPNATRQLETPMLYVEECME